MRKVRAKAINLGIDKLALFILFFGIMLGTLFANVFQGDFLEELNIISNSYLDSLNSVDINYASLLKYVLVKNFKPYLLIWILNITILGIPFMILFILYSGFCTGFLISILTMQYGIRGILLFLAYIFPQYLIYIPVFIITLSKGYALCNEIHYRNKTNSKDKLHSLFDRFLVVFILGLILLLGSILETYVNTVLVQKISQMF